MLRELLAWLLTPAGAYSRRSGYAREGVAIEARYRRCRRDWAPHLAQCRAVIAAQAEACAKREVAVVLGSGALLDLPLADLAGRFRQVYLLDLFHPLSARRQARRFANVTLIEHDLLGIALDGNPHPAPQRLSHWRALVPPPDFLVSLNLLTQLPLRPLTRWGEALGVPWMSAVMAAHLDDLMQGPGRVCLISEFRHRSLDRLGMESERDEVLEGFTLPPMIGQWVWRMAPPGELEDGGGVEMDVGAYVQG